MPQAIVHYNMVGDCQTWQLPHVVLNEYHIHMKAISLVSDHIYGVIVRILADGSGVELDNGSVMLEGTFRIQY